MALVRRQKYVFYGICLLSMLLKTFADNVQTPDFGYADRSLQLTGPDLEDMMMCAMPIPFSVDTTVEWYVNGKLLKKEVLPHGNLHLYESVQDFADLLGDYPQVIQCVINQGTINWIPVISNKVTLSPQ